MFIFTMTEGSPNLLLQQTNECTRQGTVRAPDARLEARINNLSEWNSEIFDKIFLKFV